MTKVKLRANIHINHTCDVEISDPSKLTDTKLYADKATKELLNILSRELDVPEKDIKVKVKYEVVNDNDEDILEVVQERLENDNGERLTTEEIIEKRNNK